MFKFTSPIGKAGLTAQQTDHYDNHCANSAVSADQNQMLLNNILLSSNVRSVGHESKTSQNRLLLQADTPLNGLKTRMKQPHQGPGAATRTNSNRWDRGILSSAIR